MRVPFFRAGLGLLFCLAVSGNASADVFFAIGNNPQTDFNLLMNTGQTGTTVQGTLQGAGSLINLTGTETLVLPSSGQARVEAQDGGFNSLTITSAVPFTGYDSLIANLIGRTAGTATITATDQFGEQSIFAFAMGTGQNFFTLTTDATQILVSVLIETSPGNLSDVRQIRLGAVTGFGPAPGEVPLPAAVFLFGSVLVGGAGLSAVRRRRRIA